MKRIFRAGFLGRGCTVIFGSLTAVGLRFSSCYVILKLTVIPILNLTL